MVKEIKEEKLRKKQEKTGQKAHAACSLKRYIEDKT